MRSFVFLLTSSLLLSPFVTATADGNRVGAVKRCADHKQAFSTSKHHGHPDHSSKHYGHTAKHSSTAKAVKTTKKQTSAAAISSSASKTSFAASSRSTTSRFHTTTKANLLTSTVLTSPTAVNLAVSTSSKARSSTLTRSTSKKALSTAAASTASSTASAGLLEKIALDTHNAIRANYSAPALVWNSELEQSATTWANKCDFNHGGGTALSSGENLGASYEDNLAGMITWWASEASEYDYSNPGWNYDAGHFTQVVWKSTTSLGCANVLCPTLTEGSSTIGTNEYLIVCHYLPAGNIDSAEEFKANVLPHV